MPYRKKQKAALFYAIGCLCLAFSLFLSPDDALAQRRDNSKQYPSTRSNSKQVEKKTKRKKGKNAAPTKLKKFEPKSRRQLKKEAKMKKKPQYADPMYFGHKRKPKKRPPGKRKLCKECGMVH